LKLEAIMKAIYLFLLTFCLGACAPLPPAPAAVDAKQFEPVPNKAVVYIVRPRVDSFNAGPVWLGDIGPISTLQGTYYRWEVDPGVRRVGTAGASASVVTLNAQAGQIYYVQHTVTAGLRGGLGNAWLRQIDEATGRRLVSQAQPI
jgi:hypothetical protein